jgi:adenylate cyclase
MFPRLSRLSHRMADKRQTFLFADISGYSRLTELGGDEVGAELGCRFASEVSAIAAQHGAEVVKRVGDGVMLRGECAAEVVRLGLRLSCELEDLPPIHAGIHTGPAVERDGDWWGTTVNIAARIASEAQAGQLLITEATMAATGERVPARMQGLGLMHLKNISAPVRVYATSSARSRPAPAPRPGKLARGPQLSLFERERFAGSLAFEG